MSVELYLAQSGSKLKLRFLAKEIKISELLEKAKNQAKMPINLEKTFLLDKRGKLYLSSSEVKGSSISSTLELDGLVGIPNSQVTLFCFNLKDEGHSLPSPENEDFWKLCDKIKIYGDIVKKPFDFSNISSGLLIPTQLEVLQKYQSTLFSGFLKLATQYVSRIQSLKIPAELRTMMASAMAKFHSTLRTEREMLEKKVDQLDSSFKNTVAAFQQSLVKLESIELQPEVKKVMPDKHKLIDIYFDKNQMIQWRHNCVEMKHGLLQAFKEYGSEVQEILLNGPVSAPNEQEELKSMESVLIKVHEKISTIHNSLHMLAIAGEFDNALLKYTKEEEVALLNNELGSYSSIFTGEVKRTNLATKVHTILTLNGNVLKAIDELEKNASYLKKPKNFIELYDKAIEECSRRREFDRLLFARVEVLKAAVNQENHVRAEFKNLISEIFPKKCLLALASTNVATIQYKKETPEEIPPIDLDMHKGESLPDSKEVKPLKMLKELGAVNANATLHAVGSQLRSGGGSARGASAEELARRLKEQSDYIDAQKFENLRIKKTLELKDKAVEQLEKQVEEREEQVRNITRKIEELHNTLRNTQESCRAIELNAQKIERLKQENQGLTPSTKKIKEKLLAEEIQESVHSAHRILHQVCGKLYDMMAIKVGQRELVINEQRQKIARMCEEFQQKIESMKKAHESAIEKRKSELEVEQQKAHDIQRRLRSAEERNKQIMQEEEKHREKIVKIYEKEIPAYERKVKLLENQVQVAQEHKKMKQDDLKDAEATRNMQENMIMRLEEKLKKIKGDNSAKEIALENKKIELSNAKQTIKELEGRLKQEERKVVEKENRVEDKLKEAKKKFAEEHKEMVSKIYTSHKKDLEKKEKELEERNSRVREEYEKKIEELKTENKQKGISLLELNNQITGIIQNSTTEVSEVKLILEEKEAELKEQTAKYEEEIKKVEILEDQISRQENSPVKDRREKQQEERLEELKEEIENLEQERDSQEIMRIEIKSQMDEALSQKNQRLDEVESEVEKLRKELKKREGDLKQKEIDVETLKRSIDEKEKSFDKQMEEKIKEMKDSEEKTLRLLQKRRSLEEYKNISEEKENQLSQSSDIIKRGSAEPVVHFMNIEQGQRVLFVPKDGQEGAVSYVGIVLTEPRKAGGKIQRLKINELFQLDISSLESNQRTVLKANKMMVVGKVKRIEEAETQTDIRTLKCAVSIEHLVKFDRGGLSQYSYQK